MPLFRSPRFVTTLWFAVLCALVSAPAALAQNRGQEPQPPPAKVEAPRATPGQAPVGAPAAVDPRTYVIGPEDVLFIRVWREMDLTGSYVVRPDGKITLPLIGEVQASGLTPDRLRSEEHTSELQSH